MSDFYTIKVHSKHCQHLLPISINIHKRFNQLDQIELIALTPNNEKNTRMLFNKFNATIQGGKTKHIVGIITAFKYQVKVNTHDVIKLTIEPIAYTLNRDQQYRIFHNKNAIEIIEIILSEHQIPHKIQLNQSPLTQSTQTQYQESTLNFINRLCAENGLYYTVENTNTNQTIVFRNKLGSEHSNTDSPPIQLNNRVTVKLNNQRIGSNQFQSHRYRADNPSNPLHIIKRDITEIPQSNLKLCKYDYPHKGKTQNQTEIISYLKQHHLKSQLHEWNTISNEDAIDLGCIIQLNTQTPCLIIIDITHQYHFNNSSSYNEINTLHQYTNSIIAINCSLKHYHFTSYHTPRISGVQTAIVHSSPNTHKSSNYSNTKMTFFWDPKESRWVRSSQTLAGNQHGVQHTARKNSLSVVQYTHNDPNTPISIGQLYARSQANPHKANTKMQSGIQTKSWNQSQSVEHCLTLNDKKNNQTITLKSGSNRTDTIQNDFLQQTDKNYYHHIKNGDLSIKVEDGHHIVSAKKIQLDCGNSQILVDSSGIHFNSSTVYFPSPSNHHQAAARMGDHHSCPQHIDGIIPHSGGIISKGSNNVFINNKPVARVQDTLQCHLSSSKITTGNNKVLINDRPLARKDDKSTHKGHIIDGSDNVLA
jgi:type VI secretion system secreted protein VgrG